MDGDYWWGMSRPAQVGGITEQLRLVGLQLKMFVAGQLQFRSQGLVMFRTLFAEELDVNVYVHTIWSQILIPQVLFAGSEDRYVGFGQATAFQNSEK